MVTPSKEQQMTDQNPKAMYRQGDVLILKVGKIPAKAVKQPKSARYTLELGEVTGHSHALLDKDVSGATLFVQDQVKHLETCLDLPLVHEEHDTIKIAPGTYEVRRQCTYSVLEEMARSVAD